QASAQPATQAELPARPTSADSERYALLVATQLSRVKRFPRDARGKHRHGATTVRFSIDADGNVSGVVLIRRSGYVSLDLESVEMVHRAAPFPPPPDTRPISFKVPIEFHGN